MFKKLFNVVGTIKVHSAIIVCENMEISIVELLYASLVYSKNVCCIKLFDVINILVSIL